MDVIAAKRLAALELINRRLKRLLANALPKNEATKEVVREKW